MLNFPISSKIAAILVGLSVTNTTLVASAPPPPPQDPHIIDAAPLLSTEQTFSLSNHLKDFERLTGISLMLVTDIEPAAEVEKILGQSEKPTLVASCSMENGQLSISANDELQKLINPSKLALLADSATNAASGHLDPGARLQAMIQSLSEGLEKEVEIKRANASSAWTALAPLALILGVSLTCLFVSGWAYAWVRSRRSPSRQFLFPSVHAEERFGAPFGGGLTGSTVGSEEASGHVSKSSPSNGNSGAKASEQEPDLVAN